MDCNQIKIFINLEIIGEEDNIKKKNCKMLMMWQVLKRSIKIQKFRFYIFIIYRFHSYKGFLYHGIDIHRWIQRYMVIVVHD